MPLTFHAQDNEFAAATGANVNSGWGTSTFDSPVGGARDLVIRAKPDDPDPRLFEVGDTYDVSFGGNGASVIEDAVVIRSDSVGQDGIIVFEGHDGGGDLVQVVWSPGFDLEQWCIDHSYPWSSPGFYTSDQNPDYAHGFMCFSTEARIATAMGGVAAGELWVGDRVATLDAGPQPVMWIGARRVPGRGRGAPVLFAPGTIGNHAPLRLSQQHRVLIRSPMAEMMFGAAEVLVPAKALVDGVGVRFDPCDSVQYVHVLLPEHHLLLAEGAACESLLLGDQARDIVDLPEGAFGCGARPARPVLSFAEAIALIGDGHAVRRTQDRRVAL